MMSRSARSLVIRGLTAAAACLALGALPFAADAPGWADDLSPIAPAEWTYDHAAHLIERAAFGGSPDQIARLAAITPRAAVDSLVDYQAIRADDQKPFDESGIWDAGMDPFPPSRAEAVRLARERGRALGETALPE